MINTTLLKKEFKSNYILLLIFLAVLSIYSCMIIAMFDLNLATACEPWPRACPSCSPRLEWQM